MLIYLHRVFLTSFLATLIGSTVSAVASGFLPPAIADGRFLGFEATDVVAVSLIGSMTIGVATLTVEASAERENQTARDTSQ
jgi:hypothetical protein